MRILWEEPKPLANLRKRRLDFASLPLAYFADAIVVPTRLGRFKAVWWFDREPTTVI
jgi:hypothetical protein